MSDPYKELQQLKLRLETVLAFAAVPTAQQAEALEEAKIHLKRVNLMIEATKCA